MSLPAAGDLIGFAVYYGEKFEHHALINGDREHATQFAIRHHGIMIEAYAGAMSDPARRASEAPPSRPAPL